MERLTPKIVEAFVRKHGTQIAAWYALTQKGYLPGEVALNLSTARSGPDVSHAVRIYANSHHLPIPATCAYKLIRREMKIETDWRVAFRKSMMKTGMALVLTHPMLEFLCAVADNVRWDRSRYFQLHGRAVPDNFIATCNALLKRGLVERKKKVTTFGEQQYELTPAGIHVVELLKLAGEFKAADAALEKKAE